MTTTAPHNANSNMADVPLFIAFELSEKTWKLGFTTGHGHKPRERTTPARSQACAHHASASACECAIAMASDTCGRWSRLWSAILLRCSCLEPTDPSSPVTMCLED